MCRPRCRAVSTVPFVLVNSLATARSRFPSSSTSPVDTHVGVAGMLTVAAAPNVPSPAPSSIDKVFAVVLRLAVTMSKSSSPSKSPRATESGVSPVAYPTDAAKVASPFPSATETVSELELAVTTSKTPSPSTSPVAMEAGEAPTLTRPSAKNACAGGSAASTRSANPTKQHATNTTTIPTRTPASRPKTCLPHMSSPPSLTQRPRPAHSARSGAAVHPTR